MEKTTMELIEADAAFDAADAAFREARKAWLVAGKPKNFPVLQQAGHMYAAALIRLRAAVTAKGGAS